MQEPVERKSLAVAVADRIAAAIASGTWQDRLPGIRALAGRYGVNPKTCTTAMQVLEQRGVIGPADTGRRRVILPPARQGRAVTAHATKRLLILSNADDFESLGDQTIINDTRSIWEQTMGAADIVRINYLRYKSPGKILDDYLARYRAEALVLQMPGQAWSAAAHERLPTFQYGGGYLHDGPVSLSAYSHRREVSRMVHHLAAQGHRRILIPVDVPGGRNQAPILQGLRDGLGDLSPGIGTWEDYCPEFSEALPEVWQRYWESAFRRLHPTAVIVTEDEHLLSLYGWCATRGIAIPRDLSVLCFSYSKSMEWCLPRPVMMRYPWKRSLAHFKEWIAGDLRPLGVRFLPLDLVEGASVARAPNEVDVHRR